MTPRFGAPQAPGDGFNIKFPFRIEEVSFSDPKANLDYDDALLQRAEQNEGGEILRLWESPVHFIVLGRTCVAEDDVDLQAASRDSIPVLRRSSGGGTVLQGPGCLNFSLVLSKDRHPDLFAIQQSYRFILDKIILAVKTLGVEAEFRPVCDLVLKNNEKKFSGNAQRRGRRFILHHGTILYDFDLALVSRYQKMPRKMPEYRINRPHNDFVANINVPSERIKKALRNISL